MKKLLLLVGLALGLCAPVATPAHAACGVNSVPQVGVICDLSRNTAYTAASVGLVPAASATDLFCISGGTTKTVSIRKITIGGIATTAITTPFLVYQRSALDTGGTAATGIALPVPTQLSPTDPVATAVLTAYTANPTVAASPILEDAVVVDLPATAAAGATPSGTLIYGTSVDLFSKGLDIPKNTTLQDCVNLNGVSVSGGSLVITIQWQEN